MNNDKGTPTMGVLETPAGRTVYGSRVRALCLDLDGTVRHSKSGRTFIEGAEDVALYPDVEPILRRYQGEGWLIFGISNQGGVAFGYKTPEQNDAELDAMIAQFEGGNPFQLIKCCFHHPEGTVSPWNVASILRKPDTGMLALCEVEAFTNGYIVDWRNSLFVGDRPEDEECARRAGIPFRWAANFFKRAQEATR